MKHIKFCPIRKDNNCKYIFVMVIEFFLLSVIMLLVVFWIHKEINLETFMAVVSLFLILILTLFLCVKWQYCKREIAFWSILTKKSITVTGCLNYAKIKNDDVQKILVWQTWLYKVIYGEERNPPKGSKPRWAEFTGNNSKKFYLHNLFILIPNGCNVDLDMRGTADGKTRLTKENYSKYKEIANNKKIIMLDGTEENYKYLRQVFEYERFEGLKKDDVKWLEEAEKTCK